jgi:hypothetical protein
VVLCCIWRTNQSVSRALPWLLIPNPSSAGLTFWPFLLFFLARFDVPVGVDATVVGVDTTCAAVGVVVVVVVVVVAVEERAFEFCVDGGALKTGGTTLSFLQKALMKAFEALETPTVP